MCKTVLKVNRCSSKCTGKATSTVYEALNTHLSGSHLDWTSYMVRHECIIPVDVTAQLREDWLRPYVVSDSQISTFLVATGL